MRPVKHLAWPAVMIDAEGRHRETPDTFWIPDLTTRLSVAAGNFAKIGFEHPEIEGERFWVEVVDVLENGHYVGRVDNDIDPAWGIALNDFVMFEPKHIMNFRV